MKTTPPNAPDIHPCEIGTHYKQHTLTGLTQKQITSALSFDPNCDSWDGKSVAIWEFTVNGKECAVWDYKGSHKSGKWSAYGPTELLKQIFGEHLTT